MPDPTTPRPLTPAQVEEIRQRAEAATAGPWWNEHGVIHAKNPGVWTETNRSCIHPACCPEPYWKNADADQQYIDADFIAAAREDIPALLADRAHLLDLLRRAVVCHIDGDDTLVDDIRKVLEE